MKIRLVALLALAFWALSNPVLANQDDAAALHAYINRAAHSGGGMCDGMRSTIGLFTGSDFQMEMFIPANPSRRFYAVLKDSGNEYFVQSGSELDNMTRLTPMDAWAEIAQFSLNYATALFFPDRPHDYMTTRSR